MGRKICGLFFFQNSCKNGNSKVEFTISLKKNKDFRYVYQNGKVRANHYLVMYVVENYQAVNRLGISISKKIGNSVVRHRFCRLIRESYRLHEKIFNSGLDIVVVAKKSAADASYHDIESALLHLCRLHHITKGAENRNCNEKYNDLVN